MGEADERTPLAIIEDLPSVEFTSAAPSAEELAGLRIDIDDDLYGPLLRGAEWIRGDKSRAKGKSEG